jgi:hypothetical protein
MTAPGVWAADCTGSGEFAQSPAAAQIKPDHNLRNAHNPSLRAVAHFLAPSITATIWFLGIKCHRPAHRYFLRFDNVYFITIPIANTGKSSY